MDNGDEKSYALSGKIMLISIFVIFFIILIMLCLHVYIRWRLRLSRGRNRSGSRRPQFVFYVDPSVMAPSRGLEASVIATLPHMAFSPKTHPDLIDCPVCLSEFEQGETGRVLPKCGHTFHTHCIDLWFQSHSTCPLCRAPVEPLTRPEIAVNVCDVGPGSSSGPTICPSSNGLVRKPSSIADVSVDVAERDHGFEYGSGCDSPESARSTVSRMLSLTRILSRERKASVSPSSDDAERGGREESR